MAEEVVHTLEIVDVDQAEAEAALVAIGVDQLALEPVLEVPVVAEPGERVGQRELHCAECSVGRALVEGDRQQRPDERRGQERRALPEDDQHQRGRRHQREDDDRPAQAGADQLEERPPGRDGHDERDEDEVDAVLGRGGDADLGDERVRAVAVDEADEEAAHRRSAGEHGAVVGDPDRRAMLGQLDENGRREGDEHAGGPPEEHDRARGEDERQRDAAAVRAFDRNRIAARERRGRKQCGDPEKHGRAVVRGRERPGGEEHGTEADQAHGHDDWRKAPTHGSPSLTSAAYHSQLSKNHSA